MEETKIRHFFEYLDYENLTQEDNSFERPIKNEKGIFVAKLNTPFAFYLPKSELCDMFQDSYGNNVINYVINLDSHSEIVQFLENFDTLCINHASDNSKLWFGKDLNSEKLIKYYNTLYELSQDEKSLYLPISVTTQNIEEIIKYNEDPDIILSVKIVGIEFFQQTFRWQIQFNKIVDSIDESDEEDDMNFDNLVQGRNIESLDNLFEARESDTEDNTSGLFNFNYKDNQLRSEQGDSIENINNSLESNKLNLKETNNKSKVHTENLEDSPEEEHQYENNTLEYEENYQPNTSNDNEYIVNSNHNSSQDGEEYEQVDFDDSNYEDVEYRGDENQYEEYEHQHDDHEYQYDEEQEEHKSVEGEEQYEDEQEHYEEQEEHRYSGGEGDQQYEDEQEHYEEQEEQHYQENSEEYNNYDTQGTQNRDTSSHEELENIENKTEETPAKNLEYENELNKSIINELAEDVNEHSDNDTENHKDGEDKDENMKTAVENYEDLNDEPNLSNDTIQEIASIISEKKIEAKKYTINASRARRALDTLSHKADEVNKEIELYENKLRACQSSN